MENLSVLVTGGAGYLGSEIVKSLVNRGDNVVVFDFTNPHPNLNSVIDKVKVVRGDITDLSRLMHAVKDYEIDRIIHLAAITRPDMYLDSPMTVMKVNVEGSLNVFETARLMDIARVVYFSSVSVYGKAEYEPVDERHPLNPTEPYTSSKVAAEKFMLSYCDCYGLDFLGVRPSHTYGPGVWEGHPAALFLGNAVRRIPTRMAEGRDHPLDLVYSKDVAAGAIRALDVERGKAKARLFNLSSGVARTVGEFTDTIRRYVPDWEVEIGPGNLGGVYEKLAMSAYSNELARVELGYAPRYDLNSGVKEYVEWYEKEGYVAP